jgi:hypothetical protein
MRVQPYDEAAPDRSPPNHSQLHFKLLSTVPLDRARRLEISLVTGPASRSITLRMWKSKGKGRPLVPGRPMHLFPSQIDRVLAAMSEAAALLHADKEPPCSTETPTSPRLTDATEPDAISEPKPSVISPDVAA